MPKIVDKYQRAALDCCAEQKEEEKKASDKVRTYTVQEILDNDSSSDEDMEEDTRMNHFPWFRAGYQNPYDDLAYDKNKTKGARFIYPKADITDCKVQLSKEAKKDAKSNPFGMTLDDRDDDEGPTVSMPNRFLVLTSNHGSCDHMLRCFEKHQEQVTGETGKVLGLVRISTSGKHKDLNKKYALDYLAGLGDKKFQKKQQN